jgi:hypothetical protein
VKDPFDDGDFLGVAANQSDPLLLDLSPYRTLSAKSLCAFFRKMPVWQCFSVFVAGSVGRFSELDDHERFWASVNRRMLASGFSSLRKAVAHE